jgi:hypothetical protein
MKLLLPTMLVWSILANGFPPQSQSPNLTSYDYRVTGEIIFNNSQSPPGATVYVMGTRPSNGRIPWAWAHADKNGRFAIEFSEPPDTFRVCAHPGETGGLLPLARTSEEAKKMPIKLTCGKDFVLDGAHREQRVEIKLK